MQFDESKVSSPLLFTRAGMREIIKKIEDLPVIVPVAVHVLTLSLKDDVELDKLTSLIESDPVLTARILKLVNNMQSGLMEKVTTVRQAAALAGLNQVRCALLGVIFSDQFCSDQKLCQEIKELWSHSLMTACLAKIAARKIFPELEQIAFVGGIMHDIGKMVIMETFPENYRAVEELRSKKGLTYIDAEQEAMDTNHCLAGEILVKQWNIPEEIVDCIAFHHTLPGWDDIPSANNELINLVSFANLLSREILCDTHYLDRTSFNRNSIMNRLGLSQDDILKIQEEATKDYSVKASYFDLDSDINTIFNSVIQKANQKLSCMGQELDIRNKSLLRHSQLLKLEGDLYSRLCPVLDKQSMFEMVAEGFKQFESATVGFFYTVNPELRQLEGVVWKKGKKKRHLLCFLDRDGLPVWEHADADIPPDLNKIIFDYKKRMGLSGSYSYNVISKFNVVSFHEKSGLFGELCILLKRDVLRDHEADRAVLLNIAKMLSENLEKIRLHEEMEKKNEELTRAILKNRRMNLKLMQTERLGAVGQLAAGAAHEINNPLAIISARAQLLQLKEKDEKRKRELSLISEQIDRISRILSNLMDFARPAPPTLQDTNIHEVIDRVLELLHSCFKKQDTVIEKQYDPEMITIKADPGQVEQVFLNVLINAQHAMENKKGKITITTGLSQDRKNIRITIEDQGEGITRKNLKKIFDPFFTTKEEGKGTGLGLSTSHGIINSHFGRFDIFSEEGKGTEVVVELPVDIADLRPPFSAETSLSSKNPVKARPKILVVDDEAHIRDILKETLENENMTVVTAKNGQDGLEKTLQDSFDLLLLDIKMPLRDGLSLLHEVRKADKSLPVIIITGMASHEEIQEALGQGPCECIRKPFHIKTLLSKIRKCLHQ